MSRGRARSFSFSSESDRSGGEDLFLRVVPPVAEEEPQEDDDLGKSLLEA
jgi:hypothetical protein